MKTTISCFIIQIAILFLLFQTTSAQTYDMYIANRRLVTPRSMEFDVYIKSTGSTAPWALRLYQAGYRFGAAFVNGGLLSGSYVAGSSELESSFGKTWGFSFNATQKVLNQSSNIGSVCPGAIIRNTARRIGTFRVNNTVNFGCAQDSISFVLSGSGVLFLSVGKYNSPDCSVLTGSLITSGARPYTDNQGSALNVNADIRYRCDSATALLSASGGLSPYYGTGSFACTTGSRTFTVSDARGCSAAVTKNISIQPLAGIFYDTACDRYNLPWDSLVVFSSGFYSHIFKTKSGCDSTVTAAITIRPSGNSIVFDTVMQSGLPYLWNGLYCDKEGSYRVVLKNKLGCDSIATLFLYIKTDFRRSVLSISGFRHPSLQVISNPTGGIVCIRPEGFVPQYWLVMDAVGRCILRANGPNQPDLSRLTGGTYWILGVGANQRASTRLSIYR